MDGPLTKPIVMVLLLPMLLLVKLVILYLIFHALLIFKGGAPNYYPNSFNGPQPDEKSEHHVAKVGLWYFCFNVVKFEVVVLIVN